MLRRRDDPRKGSHSPPVPQAEFCGTGYRMRDRKIEREPRGMNARLRELSYYVYISYT